MSKTNHQKVEKQLLKLKNDVGQIPNKLKLIVFVTLEKQFQKKHDKKSAMHLKVNLRHGFHRLS